MNYLDVYFSRVNHLGTTTAERIRNAGIRSFEKWLGESPHTVRNLSVERGIYFDGIILTSKDKEYEKIMFLEVANDTQLLIGDIMNWVLDDGTTEKWIIIQEEKKVNGTFRSFWIIRCNYLLKWVDANGHVQQSWSYLVSSLDSKIKGNFRTWNSLITPQPNKYAEILMPRWPIDRATNFIVEEESWSVVEYDHTSVPGVIYLSLVEGKINSIYDDVNNNIADTDKIANYQLSTSEEVQTFTVNEPMNLIFTLMKDGKMCNEPITYIPIDKSIVKVIKVTDTDNETGLQVEREQLTAIHEGSTEIVVQLKNYPTIQVKIPVLIQNNTTAEFFAYIEGNDDIRLDRYCTYIFKANQTLSGAVSFSLEQTDLAKIIEITDTTCVIKANAKNKLGTIILKAVYDGNIYEKNISIIPLW